MKKTIQALRSLYTSATIGTITLALALISAVWLLAISRVQIEREEAFADELERNGNLSRAHEGRVQRELQLLDQTLLILRDDYSRFGKPKDINARLAALKIDRNAVGVVSLIGSNGAIIATNAEGMDVNFSDREYFKFHASTNRDDLIVGKPIEGRFSNQVVLSLTRRLNNADGGFAGVAFMAVDPTYFAKDYQDAVLGENAALALVGLDGITRVRRNRSKISFGEDVRASKLFEEIKKAPVGHYVGVAASDGIRRAVSYRTVEGSALVVVVASSLDDVARSLDGRRRAYLVTAFIFTTLILVAIVMLTALRVRRLEAREAIRTLNLELEQRVAQRTAELEGFMYSVSHDLRAPLRMIDGYAAMLVEDLAIDSCSEPGQFFEKIRGGVKRMSALLNDLLDLSRYSTTELVKEKIDMRTKVQTVVDDLSLENKHAKIEIGDLPDAYGDRILVRQIWSNLIGNALKYSATKTEPRISIGYADGAYFVKDNGIGFDDTYQDKLFKLFSRLHNDAEIEGTGIGLAVVKRIIERHGGRISAHGDVGEGATFSFQLPTEQKPTLT